MSLLKERVANLKLWLIEKNRFFEKTASYFVGLYFLSICLLYFLSIQTFFVLPSIIIFFLKGFNFLFFVSFFVLYLISTKASINKHVIILLFLLFVASFVAIIFNPFTREITSVARISISNELYTGWAYNSKTQVINISLMDKVTALFTLATFSLSAFIFICVFPKIFEKKQNKEKVLMLLCITVSLFVIYSVIFERHEIVEIIKNKFNSTKGVKSIFDNKNTFGFICLFGFLSSVNLLGTKRKIFIAVLALILSLFGVVITVCKTAIISVLVFAIFFAILFTIHIFKTKRIGPKIAIITAWFGLFFLTLLIFVLPQFKTIADVISKMFVDYGSSTLASRFEAWRTVFQTVNGYNILIGYGDSIYMTYFISSTEAIRYWYIPPYFSAHNSFLELYLMGGLLRLIFYLFLMVIVIKAFRKMHGLEKYIIISAFVSYFVCSLFESVILCDHTTLAFIPSLLFVSFTISPNTNNVSNVSKNLKSIIFGDLAIKEFFKKNWLIILLMAEILFCSILSGYSFYYKDYGLFAILLLLSVAGLLVLVIKRKTTANKMVFIFNYWIAVLISSIILFVIFICDKNGSFLIGSPFSFQENKYKDIVSVHYIGGFYPFLFASLMTAILYFKLCFFCENKKAVLYYDQKYEIEI